MLTRITLLVLAAMIAASCSDESSSTASESASDQTEQSRDTISTAHYQPIVGTIYFNSKDGLSIAADVREVDTLSPWLILCHQAGWSRGEYYHTAQWLNSQGFNCIAIDQRSGDSVRSVVNETAQKAREMGLPTEFLDAEQDIEAAIDFVDILIEGRDLKRILVGSSYSSALVLKIAGDHAGDSLVDGVVSFSPGEYFPGISVAESAKNINVPTFVTAARNEKEQTLEVANAIPEEHLNLYFPKGEGAHGSRALWEEYPDHEEYRTELLKFLEQFKN